MSKGVSSDAGWNLNLPSFGKSDITPCPEGCPEKSPHHHFGKWAGFCDAVVPGTGCICQDD